MLLDSGETPNTVYFAVMLDLPRDAAGNEFSAALLAYKRRELMETLASTSTTEESDDETNNAQEINQNVGVVDSVVSASSAGGSGQATPFRAAGALIFPGLDRGRTLWEEDNFQSSSVLKTVPVPLGGFFTNGVSGEPEGTRLTCPKPRAFPPGTSGKRLCRYSLYTV